MHIYLNEKVVPEQEAVVSVFDHGFLYGDGIYETMRVYDGVLFMFDEHLKRLNRSAGMISLALPKSDDEIRAAVEETLKANKLLNASVRVSVTRGPGPLGLDPDLCPKPTFVVYAHPFDSYPRELYETGVSVMIAKTRRNDRDALDPRIKSHNFLNNILAKIESKQGNHFEAIMRNIEGALAEGTVTNLFFITQGVLCTPALDIGILDGITRSVVIDLGEKLGLKIREGKFRPGDLKTADEVFLSNSLMEVMPVVRVGDEQIVAGRVGHHTQKLMDAYSQMVREYVRERQAK